MPRYVFFFNHTSDTRAQMTGNPGYRTAAVRRVVSRWTGHSNASTGCSAPTTESPSPSSPTPPTPPPRAP